MFDSAKLLNQFMGAGGNEGLKKGKELLSNNAGGLAAGGLAGYLLGSKKGRKIAKKGAAYGGMALVAGLAYKAYSNHQQQKASQPSSVQSDSFVPEVPKSSSFHLENQTVDNSFQLTLISAMIAAAKADGHIDAKEQQSIFDKIDSLNLGSEEKAFIFDQLNKPLDIDSLVARAQSKEQALEIYVASFIAIEVDTTAEQAYLTMLAARLELEPSLVEHVHQTLIES